MPDSILSIAACAPEPTFAITNIATKTRATVNAAENTSPIIRSTLRKPFCFSTIFERSFERSENRISSTIIDATKTIRAQRAFTIRFAANAARVTLPVSAPLKSLTQTV